jgi:LuxR family maltose regulon positive regulatory protein
LTVDVELKRKIHLPMVEPLLHTKLYIPKLQPGSVLRPGLLDRLNGGMRSGCRLTLLSAPAGYGKTTLLVAWVAQCGRIVAWLSLDEGDNDPVRFMHYLFAALSNAGIVVGLNDGNLLPTPRDTRALLVEMINQVGGSDREVLLVLDDYHTISSGLVHESLMFLLDHLPVNLHLAIASRSDPPFPLARLRARGQLAEYHLVDLRFTPEEATEFLNRSLHLDLSAADIASLVSRTEGWVAGLQMAALTLRDRQNPTGFIRDFTGSDRFVLDYLMEEVLDHTPADVQAFLLKSSILERLSGPLCEAVLPDLKSGEGQEMLERLEAANLFLLPLDNRREWYRYHRLFADLLGGRLRQSAPDEIEGLHRRACAWFETNGLSETAIRHALEARDFEHAAGLIEANAESTLLKSQIATLRQWIESLPADFVQEWPRLYLFQTWGLILSGASLKEIESRIEWFETEARLPAAYVFPLKAYVALFQGHINLAIELSHLAAEQLPPQERFLCDLAKWVADIGSLLWEDREKATRRLEDLIQLGLQRGNLLVTVLTLCSLADTYMSRGEVALAKATSHRALDLAKDSHGNPLPVSGAALIRLGEILREENELDEAEDVLQEGIRRLEPWSEFGVISAHFSLALVQQARGESRTADETIQTATRLALEYDATELDDRMAELFHARIKLAQGDLDFMRGWLERAHVAADVALTDFDQSIRQREDLLRARALVAIGRPQEALSLLTPLGELMEQAGRKRRLIEVLVISALAHQALGRQDEDLVMMTRALELAQASGLLRIFLDEGEPMRQLLGTIEEKVKLAPPIERYVKHLLAAFGEDALQVNGISPVFPEPLSERELEVLRLLRSSLTVPEIADRLSVAESTVRSHVKSIYGKLGVHRRMEAIERAEALNLFSI